MMNLSIFDFAGQSGNYASNVATGNAQLSLNLNAGSKSIDLISGVYDIATGSPRTSFTKVGDETLSKMQDLLGSPVVFTSDGVSIKTTITDISIKKNDDNTATVSFGFGREVKGTDIKLGAEINITASTQDGPAGTMTNRKSEKMNREMDETKYILSPKFMIDLINGE